MMFCNKWQLSVNFTKNLDPNESFCVNLERTEIQREIPLYNIGLIISAGIPPDIISLLFIIHYPIN